VVSWRHVGPMLELVVVGWGDALRQACEALEPAAIDVLDLNLEDAFVEYTRGPKRSLPSFTEEGGDEPRADHQGAA
jgi:ABC-2 type transport system ATP-binding protein